MTDPEPTEAELVDKGWRARPLILATIGAVATVLIQQLIDRNSAYPAIRLPVETWRIALAIAIGTGALALGFGMERVRLPWALAFAAFVGAVAGLVFYWNGEPGWGMVGDWRCASLLLSIAIAVPLFQTARDAGAWRFPYADVHGHAWTNVVLWFACWLFVGIAFALAWLLAALFDLIGLRFLHDLLERHWFMAALVGAGFGGALGLLRERDRVVRLLQRVVTAVLGVLAPVLGAGLLLFLVALPFTGLNALWEATKSTTPILLGCVIGALILANAVIGNGKDEDATNPVLRVGAMALALSALPLAVIAAIATGLRIGQYGLTPDRLWALVFVVIATAYGLAYLVSLARGRMDWASFVRPANLHLAFVVAGIALFLATPILSFNALSTRDQVARLESGGTTIDKFDWAALAFDFGDPGKSALKRLASSKNVAIASRAKATAAQDNRYGAVTVDLAKREADALTKRLRVLPDPVPVPQALREQLTEWNGCGGESAGPCTVLYKKDSTEALAARDACIAGLTLRTVDQTLTAGSSGCKFTRYRRIGDAWTMAGTDEERPLDAPQLAALKAGLAAGKVEIRTVPSRQVFVGGVPVGDPFK